ncbi:MAG TPA: efflux RND transporter periplasmic adaptor subunit [Pyrinomonadaceae bacterium]|nr:efflux RND transporter periplasmic adaptor subunit [Pyrinomonadaceae bacterium]
MRFQNLYKIAIILSLSATFSFLTACKGSKAESANANANANTAPSIVETTTAQAVMQNVPTYFEATGSLAGDAQTDVAPTVGGKVVAVNFDVGSYVEKGSVMVQLDDRDARIRLEQSQAQVQQAESQVNQAQSQVETARANVRQTQSQLGLQNGGNFSINDVAEVKTAKAALDLAEKELRRAEKLLETGDIARTLYDQRKTQYEQALAQYQAAVNGANQRYAAIRSSQAQVDTALAGVRTAQSAVEAAKTQVSAAQKAISDAVIRAPISGYIAERTADLGEFVTPNTPNSKIATIVRTSVLRLRIDVPEQNIGQVAVGQGISLQTSAYPDRNFSGRVVRMLPSVNSTSRVLVVEAEVENVGGLLKPGQFATVRINQGRAKQSVMIPATAVKTEGDTNSVFVIKDGRAEQRQVKLGILENNLIEIQQGVQENEAVAASNLNQIYDGVAVSVK